MRLAMRTSSLRHVQTALLAGAVAVLFVACSDSSKPDGTPPATITDLTVAAADESTATLTWTAPGDDGTRGTATAYDLRFAIGSLPGTWDSAPKVIPPLDDPARGGTGEVAVIGDLTPESTYLFALRTRDDSDNWSAFSNTARADVGDPAAPGPITDLRAMFPGPHAITLFFAAPGDDGSFGRVDLYEIRAATTPLDEATWDEATPLPIDYPPQSGGTEETIRVVDLHPGTTVHLAVRARDDAFRWSPVSNSVEVTLPADDIPPGTIEDLRVVETGIYRATLAWTAPGNDHDEARVDGYEVRYAEAEITSEEDWAAATEAWFGDDPVAVGNTQTASFHGLPGNRDLWFAVRATDQAGQSGAISNGVSGFVRQAPRLIAVREDGSGDQPTIQAAIDDAVSGDEILVYPGTYFENIDFSGKDVYLHSAEGVEVTTIDGSRGSDSVVKIMSGEGPGAILEGFTITGGIGWTSSPTYTSRSGGGVLVLAAGPVIRSNRIMGNSVNTFGGGLLAAGLGHVVTIEYNEVSGNRAGWNGGGLGIGGSFRILGNVVTGNQSDTGDGAGIWVHSPSGTHSAEILGNVVTDNSAGDHGGGIYSSMRGTCEIAWNVIARNSSGGKAGFDLSGGGIWLAKGYSWVHHNTLWGNEGYVRGGTAGGGGIASVQDGNKLIEQNIVANTGFGRGILCEGSGTTTLRNNMFWNNVGGAIGSECGAALGEDGNAEADPLFCDPTNDDFRLQPGSPALTNPSGVIGAFSEPGCGAQASSTWSALRRLY